MKRKLNFLAVKPVTSLRLLVDFCLGQSNLVVEVRRRGSAEKEEEADGKQSDAEAQSQSMIWAFLLLPTEKENKMSFRTSTFNVFPFHVMSEGKCLHWCGPV